MTKRPQNILRYKSRHRQYLGESLKTRFFHVRIRGCCGYGELADAIAVD